MVKGEAISIRSPRTRRKTRFSDRANLAWRHIWSLTLPPGYAFCLDDSSQRIGAISSRFARVWRFAPRYFVTAYGWWWGIDARGHIGCAHRAGLRDVAGQQASSGSTQEDKLRTVQAAANSGASSDRPSIGSWCRVAPGWLQLAITLPPALRDAHARLDAISKHRPHGHRSFYAFGLDIPRAGRV